MPNTSRADRFDRIVLALAILIPLLTGIATFYASAASAQDVQTPVVVAAGGKVAVCVVVSKTVMVCTLR